MYLDKPAHKAPHTANGHVPSAPSQFGECAMTSAAEFSVGRASGNHYAETQVWQLAGDDAQTGTMILPPSHRLKQRGRLGEILGGVKFPCGYAGTRLFCHD